MQIRGSRSSERGAALVHVALALIALMSVSTFVIDYGVLWVSRNQAQNAADSAALAAAVGLAFDNSPQSARDSAAAMLQSASIWGQTPVPNPSDITIGPCPDDATQTCVKVDVFRNQARGNPLPTFFGQLLGLSQQGVRATATATTFATNSGDCFKPWGLADKWLENNQPLPWGAQTVYDPTAAPGDSYVPPNPTGPGTGFDAQIDHGRQLQLKLGKTGDAISGGWFQAINTSTKPNPDAVEYQALIRECEPPRFKIGDVVPLGPFNNLPYGDPSSGMLGATRSGVGQLIAQDPGAYWDPNALGGQGAVVNSCVSQSPPCQYWSQQFRASPRVVTIPVFDLELFRATGGANNGTVKIVGVIGFFVDRIVGNEVQGYVVSKPGVQVPCAPSCAPVHGPSSFTKVARLVR